MGYFIHEDQPAGLPLANLDELNDANISSPADKDVLSYDATTQKWVNDSSVNSNMPRVYSKTITNLSIDTLWGNSLYFNYVTINTDRDWRNKRIIASFITTDNTVLATIAAVTSSNIKIMLIRPTSLTVSGTLYVQCYNE